MEENYRKVIRIFFGTRADLAPYPLAFLWDCESCQAPTYSAAEPPPDQTHVCHVCASQISVKAEQDSSMDVAWRMTKEGEEIINDTAKEKQRPVEEMLNRVLEWKLRRPIKGTIFYKSEKKKPT